MPRTIRFHLDENCSHAIAAGLRRRGIDATTTPEAGLLGAIDEEQLRYCLVEARVIFSYDDDLLRLAASGIEHAGVVYCQQRKRSIGNIVRGLVLIWERLDPADLAGHVKFL
jgi:predicted nuclease of predicted toxin-antitoxin system